MPGVRDKIWFLRGGLVLKYVMSLVGLVVFGPAADGAARPGSTTRHPHHAGRPHEREGRSHRAADRADGRRSERQISSVTRARAVPPNSTAPTTPSS